MTLVIVLTIYKYILACLLFKHIPKIQYTTGAAVGCRPWSTSAVQAECVLLGFVRGSTCDWCPASLLVPPNRTPLKARSRIPLWRSCTCSARRAGVSTTGSPRSASPSADPGHVVSLCPSDAVKLLHQEILVLIGQDESVSAHPWMDPPEEDSSPGSTAPGPERAHARPSWTVASRPVHAKMTLILYVNEVRHATRATHRPSFFVRMRFGEEGEATRASCASHRANVAPRSTRSRRRSGAETEASLKKGTFF